MPQTPPYRRILVLTSNESHAKWDMGAAQKLKPAYSDALSTGSEGLAYMKRFKTDLVLLDSTLEDMDGIGFLLQLKEKGGTNDTTVIMVTTENRRNKVLDSLAAGCSGYILRPYSQQTFERHILQSKRTEDFTEIEESQLAEAKELVGQGAFDDAIEAFEEILEEKDEAERYYDMGMGYLVESKYGKAIVAFKKAVKLNNLFAEAYKGLAEAYEGKGKHEEAVKFLKHAAGIHAHFDQLDETKELFIKILKMESEAPNPFNSLGVQLRRKGDTHGAIKAYKRALELTPDDEHVYFNLSKAYLFLNNKENAEINLRKALSLNGEFGEARTMFETLTGLKWAPSATARTPSRQATSELDD
ncbi:MAG: response regulator [Desulfovibrio sp.]|nr:MAG: response regulator [Desulfovibrio sp.]